MHRYIFVPALILASMLASGCKKPPQYTQFDTIITFAEISTDGVPQLRFTGEGYGALYVVDLPHVTITAPHRQSNAFYAYGVLIDGTQPPRFSSVVIEAPDVEYMQRWRDAIAKGSPVILLPEAPE